MSTIDEYIAGFPTDVQTSLEQVRTTIKQAAPEAEEAMSYQIPTFKLAGRNLIHFAAYRQHIGLYPAPMGDAEFQREMSIYTSGKSTLRFPLAKPMPLTLIEKIVQARAREHLARAEAKAPKA